MERIIKNKELQEALKKEGLSDVLLVKGRGYFYLIGKEGTKTEEALSLKSETSIFVNSFKELSIPSWVEEIKDKVNKQ